MRLTKTAMDGVRLWERMLDWLVERRMHLKATLGREQRDALVKFQALRFRRVQHWCYRLLIGSNLRALATVYNSDKWGTHEYAARYEAMFARIRRRPINVLEIGIGGYDDPERGGGSLRMWRTYFPRGHIYGIDVYDKAPHDESRIKTFRGSQADEAFLASVVSQIGPVDVVIDDGSHVNEHVLAAFAFLFPRLSAQGIYVIEDAQTSYWEEFGGTSTDLGARSTTMGFFKSLVDGVNHREFRLPGYEPTYYDRHVVSLHFWHNMIVIQKGIN